MEPYKNLSGDSGVAEFEIGPDFIKVRFVTSGTVYVYDHSDPGPSHVKKMKHLATSGKGLATHIAKEVKKRYSRKE